MKFEDDDLKDGKLWAALQKEIDRDLAEKESGETFQEELADIEDSIEFESKETKSEDHIPDETANLSNLRSVLEATERAKDEEAKQKMKQTKVEPVTQDIEIPEFTEEEEEIEETPAETKTESEPEEVMVDDDLIINDPFADEDDLLGEEKTETKGSEKEVLGDQVEAAMERLVSDTVGHIPMPEIDDEDDDYDDYEDDDEEYIPHGAKPQKKKGKGGAVIAVAAVAVIAVGGFFYGSKMFHYQNYFFNGTTINGVDCSDMTAKEAETKIKEQAANYTLNVKFKDNDTKSVSGKDIDYTYAGDGSVESVLKKQNSFLWFLGNGGKEKDSQVTMQYSQEKLDAVIDGFDEFQSADGENAPASAYITFQNNEFEIVDAVMGEGMDLTLAKQCIENALQELMEALRYVLNSREDFDVVRATLARDSPASDVQKAAWFYELIRYSYAAGLTSFGSQPHDMWSNFPLIEQAHRRLAKVVIENKDFEKLIRQYDRPASLFYLDPPYHATEDYYQNIGEDGFTETDHIRLRDALMRIEGKFLLSYNDDEFIRSLYDRPGIYLMETTRINNIKQRYDNGAQFPELIIANYDMHERLRVAPSQMNLFDLTGGDTAWLKS